MTRYEKRLFFNALSRILTTVSPRRNAAVLISDWMEDADPEFDWEPDRDHRARRVDRKEWNLLLKKVGQPVRSLANARPDRRSRATRVLARLVGLNAAETAILELAPHSNEQNGVGGLCDLLLDDLGMDRDAVVALLTNLTKTRVNRALSGDGQLFAAGLLDWQGSSRGNSLGLGVSSCIGRVLEAGCGTPDRMRAELFPAAAEATTEWEDFDHLGEARDLAARVVKGAVRSRRKGVNILFYGAPGTGKTEFCKLLAREAGQKLHAIGEADEDGDAPSSRERANALRLAQRLLSRNRGEILLFDELEDLLERDMFSAFFGRRTGGSKVHLHRMLETNPVPVLWTMNEIEACDPALLRRMTLCLELRIPGPNIHERIWKRLTDRRNLPLTGETMRRLAREVEVPPALVAGALEVAHLANGGERDISLAVGAADKALRGGRLKPPGNRGADAFDPALISADADVHRLIERLASPEAPRDVSFCFSGPPGTGKSALARHLAGVMGLPVIQKRASDLLSKWVGGSEAAISAAFAQAREEGAFLIFDEADSLLGDRSHAERSWEISQVNEMLTWMESHPFPFACTTNLAGRLDPATRRRFTVHADLLPLDPPRLRAAFERIFGKDAPAGLAKIAGLTPGDLVAVKRRCRLLRMDEPTSVLGELEREAQAKDRYGFRVGFMRSFPKRHGETAQ